MQVGIVCLKLFYNSRKIFDLVGFRKTEIEFSACDVIKGYKFLLYFICHADQVFGAVPKKYAFIRQTDAEAGRYDPGGYRGAAERAGSPPPDGV